MQILKEITSQLNSMGIDLLNRDFVLATMKSCRESIVSAYSDVTVDISEDSALQLLADIVFLEIALSGNESGEFEELRGKLLEKVHACLINLTLVY